jgi:hypothetical protein
MKRASLIVLIVILTGFLFDRFVFTFRVNKPGVQTEGRGADKIAGAKDAETRKEITARLKIPPAPSPADRTSEIIQGVTKAPESAPTYPHEVRPLHSPSDFPELPQDFRKLLISRGCQIPEYVEPAGVVKVPETVISGDFAQSGQTDWAVICEKDDQSSIVVFWAKPTGAECDPELEKSDNRDYHERIQAISSLDIVTTIDSFNEGGPDFTAGSWTGLGFPPPEYPNLSHSGIVERNANKGFGLSYCSQGHWYQFQAVG